MLWALHCSYGCLHRDGVFPLAGWRRHCYLPQEEKGYKDMLAI